MGTFVTASRAGNGSTPQRCPGHVRSWRRFALALGFALASAAALAADPQIASFVDNPDPAAAGGNVTYTATVSNSALDDATSVVLSVPVPAGATFVSATAPCAQSAGTVTCNLGTVAGNGADVRSLDFVFRATGPGPTSITATATVASSNDTNAANNTQSQTTTVLSGGDLSLTKTGAPDPVVGGANVTYTLTASNAGPNASGAIVVTDNLSPSTTYVSSSGTGWSCSNAGSVVTCNHAGPHPAGAAISALSIVARVTASGGTITNSATVAPAAGGTADPDSSNNTATANTNVLPGADVRIAQKIVTTSVPAVAGQNVGFRIDPRNGGPATAINAVVTDTLPAGWTFVSASGPNWACSAAGQTVTCTRASLPTSATDNIAVVATAPSNAVVGPTGSTYTNTASVASSTADPDNSNDSGSVNVTVLPDGADLRISKSKTPNPVAQGGTLTSTIRVTNNGPRTATGPLRVVELLSGETFQSATGTGWTCDATNAPTIVCSHANAAGLAVNASLPDLVILSTATAAGSLTNNACTGASVPPGAAPAVTASPPVEGDPNPGNDCAGASSLSTTTQPDLAIAKATSTPTGGDKIVSTSETAVTYTLVVSNITSPGTDAATGVVVRDTVPGYIAGRTTINAVTATVSAGTATFACAISGAQVTCTQSGGQLAPGQTVTIPITVNRPLQEGSYTNTATVSNTAEGDPNANNNSASDTVQIDPIADVAVTGKTATPAAIRAGEQTTYVISYKNNGPSPATIVAVGDQFTFPAGDSGVTVVSIASTKPGSTCTVAAGQVLAPGSDAFSCTVGTMANNETHTITLVVRANFQSGNAIRTFNNTATITTTSVENPAGGDNGNNSFSAALTVNPSLVDLLTNKIDFVDPVPYAGNAFIDYRVNVTSNGPSYATNVRITEVMTPPAGKRIRFVCDTTGPASATCNAPSLCSVTNVTSAAGTALAAFTCDVPAGTSTTGLGQRELASGQTKPIYLRFEAIDAPAPSGDVFSNQATVSANETDSFPGNDTSVEQTTVRQRIDLAVAKTSSVPTVTLRQPFTWTVTVTNNGPGNSAQTDVTDVLPAGVTVTGPITWATTSPVANGTCSLAAGTITCALGVLNSTGVSTITIPARIDTFPAGGTLANSATVDTDPNKIGGLDPVPSNNTGTSTITVTRSSLGGTVFEDRDRAGANGGTPQSSATEPRVAGVTVTLTGTDAYGNAVSLTTTTDGSGNYTFANLSPSDGTGYTITETQPAGYLNSPASPPNAGGVAPSLGGTYAAGGTAGNSSFTGIAVGGNATGTNYNFPEVHRPSLGGFVYIDANLNNVRDAGTDTAIVGATVRLLDAGTLVVIATATTDNTGAYVFTNLDPFTSYSIEEPLPSTPVGLRNGGVNPGLVGGAACATGCTAQPNTPAANTDRIAAIDLSSGADGTAFNFGEQQQTAISGLVFVDANRNAALDGTDTSRLAGVTVRLVQGADCATGTLVQSTTTAADGTYAFINVLAFQNYLVCETQPSGYGTGSANGTVGSNVVAITNLAAAGSTNNDFGETLAQIAGSVYQDYSPGTPANNNNGVRDAGELGIANVPVTITGTDINGLPVSVTVLTDASGNYVFDALIQSNATGYTITEGAIPPASGAYADGRETAGTLGGSVAVNDVIGPVVVPAGTLASGYLFGELPIAPISGTVYLDRNRNGTIEASPTDGRIAGVTVRLVQGASCATGTVLQTTTTAADGTYSFSGATAGANYLVCETQPAGYAEGSVNPGASASTPAVNTIAITNLPAAGSAGNQFGERAGSITGNVFLDANNDGLRAGDAGIAGVTVTLSGTDAAGNPVSRTTTTDGTGAYRFDDVLGAGAGGYTITEQVAQPVVAGRTTLNGRVAAGTAGGTPSAVATTPSTITTIALAAGVDSSENNFGEILPVTLSGAVFIDLNNNGVQNPPGDTGLPGVVLTITGTDDTGAPVSRNVTTAADGTYTIADLRPGTYTITEPVQPTGTSNGQTTPGTGGGTATPPATLPSAIAAIVLTTPGATSTGNNFAEIANTSAVTGRVWLDLDNNALINGSEAGIAGITITLNGVDLGGTAVSRTTTTDANGNYSFANLPPGTYALGEPTQPASTLNGTTVAGTAGGAATPVTTTPSGITGIVVGVGVTSSANNFGELPPASIAGQVIGDSNNNGRLDPGETGIANVPVVLTGTDDLGRPVSITITTDASGNYLFPGLRPGTYTVTEPTQPAGTVNGTTTAGTIGGTSTGTATPTTTVPSAVSAIVLPPGGASIGNNFAEIGNSPDLLVSKAAVEARFTVNNVGNYTIRVRNGGQSATNAAYTVRDRLPAGLVLDAVPTGTGWVCTGAIASSSFTCASSDVIAAGASNPSAITVKVRVSAAALQSSPAINAVLVDGGGELPARAPSQAELDAFNNNPAALPLCNAAITQNACRTATVVQAAASISGTAWYDIGGTRGVLEGGDRRLAGWQVEITDASGAIVARAVTGIDGTYRVNDLLPGTELHVRFRDPAANVVWGYPVNGEAAPASSGATCHTAQSIADGTASSCTGAGADPSLTVVLASGQNLPQQSLPVDPSGVVYDSGTRQPVPGSIVTLAPVGVCAGWNPATGLVAATLGGYSVVGTAVSMTVGNDGFYQFLFAPAAPASCTFSLTVTPPPTYTFVSVLIPPTTGPLVAAGAPGSTTLVQPQAAAPTGAVGPATTYYLTLVAGSGTANIIHNHLPLDPASPTGLSLAKTGDRSVVELGDTLRYTITVQRSSGPVPRQVTIVDRLPAGFTFVAGTAVVNGTPIADPAGKPGPALTFNLGPMSATGQLVLQYRVRVGVGAQQGDGTNRAIGYGCGVPQGCTAANGTSPLPGSSATNEGRFQVKVTGGVFTTEACFAGKIFIDCNNNHVQDAEEIGIPGVRLLLSDGTTLVSDSEGKYSYCGLPPRSHVLRVDETTLPRGSRLTTSSNRNLGDAGSLWLDLKNGELHRADFVEGSCSAPVVEQTQARRAQGEVRSVETEKKELPALRFDSRDKGPKPRTSGAMGSAK